MSAYNRCIICSSGSMYGAFCSVVSDRPVMVCWKCSEQIKSVDQELVKDCQYDDFIESIKGVREIVINISPEGFALSHQAQLEYVTALGIDYALQDWSSRDLTKKHGQKIVVNGSDDWARDIARDDKTLVDIVRRLGERAAGLHSELRIVRIPIDVDWFIERYGGDEWVSEYHRRWY